VLTGGFKTMFHKVVWAALAALAVLAVPAASANEARVLESGDDEVLIELATDDYSLEELEIGGESFVRVIAAGYDHTGDAGLPSLPRKAVLVGVPFGARLALEVVSTESENLGVHRVEPTPAEEILGDGEFATPVQRFTIDEDYYGRGGTFPFAIAELGAQGTLRHQRVARVVLNPFQYSASSGSLTLHRKILVRISIVETRRPPGLTDAVRAEPEWERTYSKTVLNHEQAAKWRARHEPGRAAMKSRSARRAEAYRVLTTESGMHRLDFAELSAEGLSASVPVDEVAVFQRSYDAEAPDPFVETPLAIDVVDADENGFFDDADYVLFHALSFEQQHMPGGYEDSYGSENAYWFAHDAELAVRMDTRPGWLDEVVLDAPPSFRDTVRFEEDVYFDVAPDDDNVDLYHWTRYQLLGDNYTFPFTLYDVYPPGDARIRTRYHGMTSGFHYIDFRIAYGDTADNYVGQFSFSGISENMNEDIYQSGPIPTWYFTDGSHTLRATGSRGSGANLDWFEFGYDREFTARGGRLGFTNAGETGTSQFEVDGFASDQFRLFDVSDPFATVELTLGPENVAGGAGDYTLTFQDDVAGFTRYESTEEGGDFSVTDVKRRDYADLWADEADVIVVSYDGFASGVEPLIAHREAEGWVVAHALVSEVYDEFGGGLKSLQALRDYFDFAFREWERTPQFVMLVGDATVDPKGRESTSQPDFIPTVLGHGSSTYPQMTASDQWFVSSSEEPFYLPQMFIGRLSVGGGTQLDNLVSKTLAYESYSVNDHWRNNVYFVGDDQWHYGTAGGSYSWDFGERRFTEVCVELAEMVAASPADVDTTLFMLRRYTDEFHESNGVTPGSEPWDYFISEVYPYVRSSVTPELFDGLSDGAVIVNFQGHGNRSLMTHEQLVEAGSANQNDLGDLGNDGKPFIFLGFSCHLAEFHNYKEGSSTNYESIVEQMLFLPSGRGAVAGFACAGAAYLSDNVDYNRAIFRAFFESDTPAGQPADYFWPRWTLGSILGEGTVDFIVSEGYSSPARTFVLLGDPLLHLEMSPPTVRVTVDGASILSGEYLEASDGLPVTFVADIIDEVEIDPSTIVVEDRDGVVDDGLYTVEAMGDTLGELGRWYRLTYETVIADESYDIRISATDLNGQTGVFVVHVAGSEQIALEYVINHPNPFYDTTRIIYSLNQSGAEVKIDIYTIGGRLIKTIDDAPGDLNYNEVEWDAVDGDGDLVANGLYLYVLEARGADGSTATSKIGRMVVARGPRFDK
jgi:hypothetical protein